MLNLSVNYGHAAVLALVNFLFSWAWYSPVLFAKPWMRALGKDPDRAMEDMTEAEKKMMPFLFLNGAVTSFMLTWTLSVLNASFSAQDFKSGACIGFLCWFGFTLTGSLSTMWEGRKSVVLLINNGLFLLTYVVYGGLLAAWH